MNNHYFLRCCPKHRIVFLALFFLFGSFSAFSQSCPDACYLTGDYEVCPGESTTISVNNPPGCYGPSYTWAVYGDYDSYWESGNSVTVVAGHYCGSYTVAVEIECDGCIPVVCSKTVDVVDETPPSITCPPDVTVGCGDPTDPYHTGTASCWDNCAGDHPPTYLDQIIPGSGESYTIKRTWKCQDYCGNASTCVQHIYVQGGGNQVSISCPSNVWLDCGESTHPSQTGYATCWDGYGNDYPATYSDYTIPGDCDSYTIQRTWTCSAGDCGDAATCIQYIYVEGSGQPSISCPSNVWLDCDESTHPSHTGYATCWDACGNDYTATYSDYTVPGDCDSYTIQRTWTCSGGDCGDAATCIQYIYVEGSGQPSISCPSNVWLDCDESTHPSHTGYATCWDACGNDYTATYSDYTVPGDCDSYTIQRTWTCSGGDCGDAATCIQYIYVEGSGQPSISCPSNVWLDCDESTHPSHTGYATCWDACGNDYTATYSDYTIPGDCDSYTIQRTWTCSGGDCGDAATCIQYIYVEGSGQPSISCPSNVWLDCDESTHPSHTGYATCWDACGNDYTATYSDYTIPGDCDSYTIQRTWTCSAGDCGDAATCIQYIYVEGSGQPSISCPSNVWLDCDESTHPSHTGYATCWDACGNDYTATYSDYTIPGDCDSYTIQRTWTCSGGDCGDAATCIQYIYVEGSGQPSISCPSNVWLDCDESTHPSHTGYATCWDACGNDYTATYSDYTIPGDCDSYTIQRTWTCSGGDCGDAATCIQYIYVEGSGQPSISCPSNVWLDCNESTHPSHTGYATCWDACGNDYTATYSDYTIPGDCDSYTIQRTWTCSGGDCGDAATCIQYIYVEGSGQPSISCPSNVWLDCDESTHPSHTGYATCWDACGNDYTATYSDYTIPGDCDSYTIQRTWTCSAGDCGDAATCIQYIYVEGSGQPSISCPSNVWLDCDESTHPSHTGYATCWDACGNDYTATYSDYTIPGDCDSYTIQRTWTCSGGDCGDAATCIQYIYVEGSGQPSISCPSNVWLDCDESTHPSHTGYATCWDACGNDYTATYSDYTIPGDCDSYTIQRTWTCSGGDCGDAATCIQYIYVEGSGQPSISCPSNVWLDCDESTHPSHTGYATCWDACGNDYTATYSDYTIPGDCDSYTIQRTWTCSGGDCGDAATCIQYIYVEGSGQPSISCPSNVWLDCGESTHPSHTGYATCWDACGNDYTATYSDYTIPGDCDSYTIQRTWTCSGGDCGDAATCIQYIYVEGSGQPSISCPSNVWLDCDESTHPSHTGYATCWDACGNDYTATYSDYTIPGDCDSYTIQRTWTCSGGDCGDAATCIQYIYVEGSGQPSISCPSNVWLDCNESTHPSHTGYATCWDACGNDYTATYSDYTIPGDCDSYTIQRTWTCSAGDCGDAATCIQYIYVEGSGQPSISCPSNVWLDCDESTHPSHTGYATCWDACGNDYTATYSDYTIPGDCDSYTIQRTWTCSGGDCGDAATCIQYIYVEGSGQPSISCPSDVTVWCGEPTDPAYTGYASCWDGCGNDYTATYSDQIIEGDCPQEYTIKRSWSCGGGDCGDNTSCIQYIHVQDNNAPYGQCPMGAYNLTSPNDIPCPDDLEEELEYIYHDNCGYVSASLIYDSGDPDCYNGSFSRTFTFEICDPCGNCTECSITYSGNCGGSFCTLTQGGWGNAGGNYPYQGGSASTTEIITALMGGNGPVVIGRTDLGQSLTVQSAQCVIALLPSAGGPKPLAAGNATASPPNCEAGANQLNNGGRLRNNLGTSTIALQLNIWYSAANGSNLAAYDPSGNIGFNLVTTGNGYSNTVQGLLNFANDILGGVYGNQYAGTATEAVNSINELFVECSGGGYGNNNYTDPCDGGYGDDALVEEQPNSRLESSEEETSFEDAVQVQVFPNPSNIGINIDFTVAEDARVTVDLYNVMGQQVQQVFDARVKAGVETRARLEKGSLPAGTYLYRVSAGGQNRVGRLVILE